MSSSILIPVLMCSILQFDFICSRSPFHPCGYSNTPIAGPTCFLYYDCTFPGEKNLVACPRFSVFDGKARSCASNSSAWISCLMNLNTNVNMNSLMKLLNIYMMPRVSGTIEDILKTAANLSKFQSSESNPCSVECQRIYNASLCVIPYDNCTGYYNCSSPLSKFNYCQFNEKFDEFKRQCVAREYASCGIGSSYPAEERGNRKLRFCTESQMTECSQSDFPMHDCVYSTKCMAYEDCSRTKVNRYVNCSEQQNNSICNILFPEDCEKLPELLDEITNGVSISTEKYVFREGDKAEFTCDSNLTSIEQFVWFLNEREINESERIKIASRRNKSVLFVSPILVQDSGDYLNHTFLLQMLFFYVTFLTLLLLLSALLLLLSSSSLLLIILLLLITKSFLAHNSSGPIQFDGTQNKSHVAKIILTHDLWVNICIFLFQDYFEWIFIYSYSRIILNEYLYIFIPGLLTCSVEYGHNFHQTDSIHILTYPLPNVTISPSFQTLVKGFNSSTQFTCNVTWSTFYLDKAIEINWFVNGEQVSSTGE